MRIRELSQGHALIVEQVKFPLFNHIRTKIPSQIKMLAQNK